MGVSAGLGAVSVPTYSWLLDSQRLESILEGVGKDLCAGQHHSRQNCHHRRRRHTTACRTSSLLLSAPPLAGFLPLAELAPCFPFCDISRSSGRVSEARIVDQGGECVVLRRKRIQKMGDSMRRSKAHRRLVGAHGGVLSSAYNGILYLR